MAGSGRSRGGAPGRDVPALIGALCDGRLTFLRALTTWPRFGKGWSRRVEEVRKAALAMVAEPAPAVDPATCQICGKRLAA